MTFLSHHLIFVFRFFILPLTYNRFTCTVLSHHRTAEVAGEVIEVL